MSCAYAAAQRSAKLIRGAAPWDGGRRATAAQRDSPHRAGAGGGRSGFDIQLPLPRGNGDHVLTASRLLLPRRGAREFIELGLRRVFSKTLRTALRRSRDDAGAIGEPGGALSSNGNLKTALDDGVRAVRS
jgi:hypothetical protein